ncbi:MAG: sialidase family protein, partial [Armatimonadota bacterium]|nr:sialidase family protein [Armatimonadota bacterium]
MPGVVVHHSPASTQQYIGSPSIAVLQVGEYVASHDLFGPGTSENRTLVFGSNDRGATWQKRAEIEGQFWSTLFVHRECLYLMGTSRQEGFVVIRRSEDGGRTWSIPRDRTSGLLLDDARYHCAPVPVVVHRGRLWRAMEDTMRGGGWAKHFRTFMMSAPVQSDLLRADSWTCSNRLARNPAWLGGKFGGWLEGNAVVAPDGRIVNILRVDYREHPEKAAIVSISEDGTRATFEPDTGFIDMPGGCKKFTIRYDPVSRLYWSLSNYVPEKHRSFPTERARNTLALICSHDLRLWEVRAILLYHPDPEKHAFQYVDWLIEGNDLIAVSRTAYDDGMGRAHNQHDANFL